MLKKTLMLAGLALALVVAAGPGSALANWTHGGSELTEEAELELTGPVTIETPGLGGAHFDVETKKRLFPFSLTGQYTSYKVKNCTGTGVLAGFTCTGVAVGLPWTFHKALFSSRIRITKTRVDLFYYLPGDTLHASPITQTTTVGDILATPDNGEAFSFFEFEGDGMTTNGNPSTLSGELEVTPAETYGAE